MKRHGILNARLAAAIAQIGHHDFIVVCGPAYPMTFDERVIDLAISANNPDAAAVLRVLREEFIVEKVVFIEDALSSNPAFVDRVKEVFPDAEFGSESNDWFHTKGCEAAKFIIRTGECSPWGNVALYSGIAAAEWFSGTGAPVPAEWTARYERSRDSRTS